jgi:hypothetical protein
MTMCCVSEGVEHDSIMDFVVTEMGDASAVVRRHRPLSPTYLASARPRHDLIWVPGVLGMGARFE